MDCDNLDSEFDAIMSDIKDNISFLENELGIIAFPDNSSPISFNKSGKSSTKDSNIMTSQRKGMITSTPAQAGSIPSDEDSGRKSSPKRNSGNSPCSPCARPKVKLIEMPGRARGKIKKKKRDSCPRITRPPFTPPGYLDYSSEKDETSFMTPLPGTEETKSKIRNVLESVDKCTRLFDFIRHISPTTCDQGQLLNFIATAEISQFKEFVQSMYKTRMQDTEELLGKEQMKLKKRYDEWQAAILRRAHTGLKGLQRVLPEFVYDLYIKDPDYIYFMLRSRYSVEEHDLHPHVRILRIKAQKKRWLTDQAEKTEKDNEDRMIELKDLNDQLNSLSKCYNTEHKEFLKRNRCLEEKAAQLRMRLHQNQKLINALIDQLNTLPRNV